MEDVRVPASNMLGGEGKGFNIAMAGLNGGMLQHGRDRYIDTSARVDHVARSWDPTQLNMGRLDSFE